MIITSLLDTDLYKFTMMQVVLHQFPGAQVEYRFKCRNPGVDLAPYVEEIRSEINSLYAILNEKSPGVMLKAKNKTLEWARKVKKWARPS